ncbi:hypothetical protein JYJ95_18650 [Corallococcus exiguus]|uniref:hypothetical protein n=1 Tax=Corallococcus exiguus TaxID=83462 RepID=UPI001A904E5D|nr:hypothetical protein [Corallococcus exiguus]MBN8468539.1 hypothetical protein [Corallococcus exiguus]
MRFTSSAALLFAASLVTACGGPLEEETPLSGQEAEVGGTSEALGITFPPVLPCLTSSTVLAQPDGATVPYVWNCRKTGYVPVYATSNDATYGQPSCVDRFVVDVTNIEGRPSRAFVEAAPATAPTTQSACNALFVSGDAWGIVNTAWETIGTVSGSGVWTPPFFGLPGSCKLRFYVPDSSGSVYTKVRVTGIATQNGSIRIRVRAGAEVFEGNPC